MDIEVVFADSAFKHGLTKADIMWAFETARYDGPVEDGLNKRMMLGFDTKGNPIEVMYNELEENRLRVFHAMPCRNQYNGLLEPEESL
jgi:hypothetical protein